MAELTLEQQFSIQSFNNQAEQMSREQAIEMLQLVYKSYICQKALYNSLLKEAWNINEFNKREAA